MYVPEMFAEDDSAVVAALVGDYSFALLVTNDAEGVPFASHLPLLFEPDRGADGTLVGHMARANPQWQHFANGQDVLVVVQGPHAYISPSWYVTEPNVPTWNYAAVHLYGTPLVLEDPAAAKSVLERLVEANEAGFETPWRMDLPANYEVAMIRDIVAFEIAVSRIEGKFKMSQNRKAADAIGARQALRRQGHGDALAVADLMEARAPTD